MKLIRKSIFALASALMLTACSSDEPFVGDDPNGGSQEGEGVYMGLTIQMPGTSGSRSQTVPPGQSTDGTEVGKDYENIVSDVLIVLANPDDNGFVTAGILTSNKLSPVPSANAYKTLTKIDKTRLGAYYETRKDKDKTVNVFVFCNPTTTMTTNIPTLGLGDKEWLKYVSETGVNAANISQKNHFLMANASIALRQLPASINDWDLHKSENSAFDLSGMNNSGTAQEVDNSEAKTDNDVKRGAIKVERAAARFDFKDGSPLAATDPEKAYTYNVVMLADGKCLIQVRLTKMTMVNLSKKFFDLRRVSADGKFENAEICGAETPDNYVAGPNATDFLTAIANKFSGFKFDTYFHHPFFNDSGEMDNSIWNNVTLLNEEFGTESDNWKGKSYKIWRYAGENVIPGGRSNQKNGISTGVVFKAKMIGTSELQSKNPELYNKLNNVGNCLKGNAVDDPILYSFNGNLYLTWPEVRKAAIEASVLMENNMPKKDESGNLTVNRSNSLYIAVFGSGKIGTFTWGDSNTEYKDGEDSERDSDSADAKWRAWDNNKQTSTADLNDDLLKAMRAAVTGAGFTIYQSSKDDDLGGAGYYCYYYYWNRHNDNRDPGSMGVMEFAVVRNNVYKLAVTNIKQLGHPRIPENDPDNPTPETPDESSDLYITVTCEVLPWVVRVNNIEF